VEASHGLAEQESAPWRAVGANVPTFEPAVGDDGDLATHPVHLDSSHGAVPKDIEGLGRPYSPVLVEGAGPSDFAIDLLEGAIRSRVDADRRLAFGGGESEGRIVRVIGEAKWLRLEPVGVEHAQPQPDELICLDYEPSSSGVNMSYDQMVEFVELIHQELGRYPVIYGGHLLRQALAHVSQSVLSKCPLWYARYATMPIGIPAIWSSYTLWQYTDGNVGQEPHLVGGVGDRTDLLLQAHDLLVLVLDLRDPIHHIENGLDDRGHVDHGDAGASRCAGTHHHDACCEGSEPRTDL